MINWLLIGHRGVGKSQLLKRLSQSVKKYQFMSLDQEIEKKQGKSILDIFSQEGEKAFRLYEIKTLKEIVENSGDKNLIVDVGAGFSGDKPKNWKALWVQRSTNPKEFIFINRPRLKNSLKMDTELFGERQKRYEDWADMSVELLEGDFHSNEFEVQLLESLCENKKIETPKFDESNKNIYITLLNEAHAKFHSQQVLLNDFSFELRDDLLSEATMKGILRAHPGCLISLRDKKRETLRWLKDGKLWDWPLEWGFNEEAPILSLHQRKNDFKETLESLPETNQILKLAIEVHDFNELRLGYHWQQEKPQSRVFLPRSNNGRWQWYRLLTLKQMPLAFIREAKGSSLDQPSFNQFFLYNNEYQNFAAILGSPVSHSFTPSFHFNFFEKKHANVLAIDVNEKEWDDALPFLARMGLRWAAVTSPLKKKAAALVGDPGGSLNTIFLNEVGWQGWNTDTFGFAKLVQGLNTKKVVIWGGGGTQDAMLDSLPEAAVYSSRTGKLKKGHDLSDPEVIIWAVGKELFEKEGVFPPGHWAPRVVIDLNYTLDSPAIECAHNFGCQYQSGLVMFTAQAEKQQEYWL